MHTPWKKALCIPFLVNFWGFHDIQATFLGAFVAWWCFLGFLVTYYRHWNLFHEKIVIFSLNSASWGWFWALWDLKNGQFPAFYDRKFSKNRKFWKMANFAQKISKLLTFGDILTKVTSPYTPIRLSGHKFAFWIFAQKEPKTGHFASKSEIFRSRRPKNDYFELEMAKISCFWHQTSNVIHSLSHRWPLTELIQHFKIFQNFEYAAPFSKVCA